MKFKKKENISNDFRYYTYLIGSMEHTAEGDSGLCKRKAIEEELKLRKVFPINPCLLEKGKIDMSSEELKVKMEEWLENEEYDTYAKYSQLIWYGKDIITEKGEIIHIPGDFDYVEKSNWITFILNRGDRPCGSFFEAGYAFKLKIPVYLITDIPILELKNVDIEGKDILAEDKKLKRSLLQAVFGSGGYVFNSENQYLHFISNQYNLTKEEK